MCQVLFSFKKTVLKTKMQRGDKLRFGSFLETFIFHLCEGKLHTIKLVKEMQLFLFKRSLSSEGNRRPKTNKEWFLRIYCLGLFKFGNASLFCKTLQIYKSAIHFTRKKKTFWNANISSNLLFVEIFRNDIEMNMNFVFLTLPCVPNTTLCSQH